MYAKVRKEVGYRDAHASKSLAPTLLDSGKRVSTHIYIGSMEQDASHHLHSTGLRGEEDGRNFILDALHLSQTVPMTFSLSRFHVIGIL